MSTGDPHLTTFDDRRFDFQAVGEFTAATDTDLTIQIRQAPLLASRTVSVNTAVALSAAGNRLGFYLEGGVVTVHRDGAALSPAGIYSIEIDPDGSTTGAVTVRLITDHDQALATAVGAGPVTATVAQSGAASRASFTATSGQQVSVAFSASTLPEGCGSLSLLAPDDSALELGCVAAGTGTLSATLATTGTYIPCSWIPGAWPPERIEVTPA